MEFSYAVRLKFKATNNQAEYKAFIIKLKLTQALRVERVKVQTNYQLVANHFNKSFQTKDEKMEQYFKCSKQIMARFKAVEVEQIPKVQNF